MQNMMSVVYAQVVDQFMMPTVIKTVKEIVLVSLLLMIAVYVQVVIVIM